MDGMYLTYVIPGSPLMGQIRFRIDDYDLPNRKYKTRMRSKLRSIIRISRSTRKSYQVFYLVLLPFIYSG